MSSGCWPRPSARSTRVRVLLRGARARASRKSSQRQQLSGRRSGAGCRAARGRRSRSRSGHSSSTASALSTCSWSSATSTLRAGVDEQVADLGGRVRRVEADRDAPGPRARPCRRSATRAGSRSGSRPGRRARRPGRAARGRRAGRVPVRRPGHLLPDAEVLVAQGDRRRHGRRPVPDPGRDRCVVVRRRHSRRVAMRSFVLTSPR